MVEPETGICFRVARLVPRPRDYALPRGFFLKPDFNIDNENPTGSGLVFDAICQDFDRLRFFQ